MSLTGGIEDTLLLVCLYFNVRKSGGGGGGGASPPGSAIPVVHIKSLALTPGGSFTPPRGVC